MINVITNSKIAKNKGLRTWLEIDKSAIKHNLAEFRTLIPKKTKLCAVVKSNAYGHSLVDFSREIEKSGADWLAVDSVVEGVRLREEGIKLPILILGYTLPEKLSEAVEADLNISVSHFEALEAVLKIADEASQAPKIHIKVDTGMHRQGFMSADAPKLLKMLAEAKRSIKVEGLFTHFAAAKNPAFPERIKKQLAEFNEWVKLFKKAGFAPIVHAAATSATILFPDSHFDMVRIGIGLYGLWPSMETKSFAEKKGVAKNEKKEAGSGGLFLKPIMTWKTIVGEVKVLTEGGSVGYDFTETLPANSKIAILPVGYWHGYPRSLSCIGKVSINNELAKVVGRVAMDMIVVDVTNIKNIKVGDEVVLIGKGGDGGNSEPTAESLALVLGDSWYEIITRLNPLIQRFFI